MRLSRFTHLASASLLALCLGIQTCPLARADVIINHQFSISGVITDDCTSAALNFSGMVHELFSQTANPNGGYHYHDHLNFDQFTAVDPVTGQQYTGFDQFDTHFNVSASVGYTQTESILFRLTSKGAATNEMLKFLYHVTVTPDGTVTSFVDHFSITCN